MYDTTFFVWFVGADAAIDCLMGSIPRDMRGIVLYNGFHLAVNKFHAIMLICNKKKVATLTDARLILDSVLYNGFRASQTQTSRTLETVLYIGSKYLAMINQTPFSRFLLLSSTISWKHIPVTNS